MKKIIPILVSFFISNLLHAASNPPITSYEHCSVSSTEDAVTMSGTSSSNGSLRQKIDLYNLNRTAAQGGRCTFNIFFEFHNRTITLSRPLVLRKNLHDDIPDASREHLRGVYIDGYGTGGLSDNLKITIDAQHITETPGQCAFMIQDGFEAKQRIKGLTILVQNEDQAICDNEGVDLYHAISPNCDPGTQAFEDDCDFSDITILTPPPSAPTPQPPPPDADRDGVVDSQDHCPGTSRKSHVDAQGCPDDQDNDGINDAHDQCPQERGIAKYHGCPIPSASMSAGQSGSGGVSGMPASGGNTGSGGIYASGGQSGSIDSGGTSGSGGNNLGSGGISGSGGTSGTSGSSGSGGSSGSAGSAGITPSRNDRPPDPFGCQLIQEK